MKILKQDLQKALAQPWSDRTCLLQQALIRVGVQHYFPPHSDKWTDGALAGQLMDIFDCSHRPRQESFTDNERLTGLCLLEAMLPMDV